MTIFDTIIVQPIFNVLMAFYAIIPGHDFGVAIILVGILVRLLMWPLVKKQLHQTKLMRAIQPELKKIKEKAAGNKQVEGQLMLELYRERGINPFSSFAVLLIQLPVFIALFQIVKIVTTSRNEIATFLYEPLKQFEPLKQIVENTGTFNESLFHVVDLTKHALGTGAPYWPLIVLAALSAFLQFYQSKQITPKPAENKRLRDILKASAEGKQSDQSEISAIVGQRMILVFPFIAFSVGLYLPGALVLFYTISSLVAVIQQHQLLKEDVTEMEELVENSPAKTKKVASEEKIVSSKKLSKQTTVRVIKSRDADEEDEPRSSIRAKKPSKKRKRR
jgi:YidC/Oxa1 family membrane protein insertase